jgi:hypothetical protein
MKKFKIGFWISTGLLSAMLLMSASMYVFNHEEIAGMFTKFGYPTYIIYPLALAKLIGVSVLLLSKNLKLKEWAYVGFFFNFILAFFAHYQIGDGEQFGALIALVLLVTSYYFNYKKNTEIEVSLA